MAFLDDELAAEERRELELHLIDCASCRQRVDSERADLDLVRKALAPPPAPALLKARIARALDAEDAALARSKRRQLSQWLLPGSAIAAAAAAILVFIGLGVPSAPDTAGEAIARDVAKQQTRTWPLEVRGANTPVWLQENFGVAEPPRFTQPGIEMVGARLLPNGIANHDAALIQYLVVSGSVEVKLNAIVLKDLRSGELGGQIYRHPSGLVLRVHDFDGWPAVSYVDPRTNVGYLFAAQMDPWSLLQLVVSTDLIARTQQVR